jgi:hypothetical protein
MRQVLLAQAAAIVLCTVSGGLAAQTPPEKPKSDPATPKVDETLFLVYLLEDYYRDTWDASGHPVVPPDELAVFLRSRDIQLDRLVNHFRTTKAAPQLLDAIEKYRLSLDVLDKLNKELTKLADDYRRPIDELYARIEKDLKLQAKIGQAEALESGAWAAVRAARYNNFLTASALGARVAYARAAHSNAKLEAEGAKRFAEARRKEREYHESNLKSFQRTLEERVAAYADKVAPQRTAAVADAKNLVEQLARDNPGWGAKEAAFDPDADPSKMPAADRPRDPLRLKWIARRAEPDPLSTASLESAHQAAKNCLASYELVPSPQAYKFARVELAMQAGLLANRVAAAEAGKGGFTTGRGNRAYSPARTAIEAWTLVKRLEAPQYYRREQLFHQTVLAYAYAKDPQAYILVRDYLNEVKAGRASLLKGAEIWVDFAKVCGAIPTKTATGAPKKDPVSAAYCLITAVHLGFDKGDEAKEHPDLESLNSAPAPVQAQLDEAIRLAKTD